MTATVTGVADDTAIGFYLVYIVLAIGLVVWLARTISRNGEVFLRDVFDSEEMGRSVNHLLVIGFYLLNMGYAVLLFRLDVAYGGLIEAFNDLITRVGVLVLSLGVIHLVNVAIFWRIRNYRSRSQVPTPAPTVVMPPPPAPYGRPTESPV